jgi:hypothetical protein
VVFEGDIQNVGDNPLNLQTTTGRLRARLEYDAPLTRLAERNAYREALIEYQQARRNYYVFRDDVARGLRTTLRTIDLNKLNFELRRQAVVVAIAQVDLARVQLQEPPRPDALGAASAQQLDRTSASNLIGALNALLSSQTSFLSVWVNYEVQRRVLDRDLGTMQLDPDGNWIDPGKLGADSGFLLPGDCEDCLLEEEILGLTPDRPAQTIETPAPSPDENDPPPSPRGSM